ncbi:PQQ-binding-like beta-propeller repeat protein [Streptomyces sp. NPDC008121]|uniref:outer membrane protein assembly factor BamB family protein n=1 Tax=Streptomyces sp. NPDC008121 TaxID=3364809 RepID=UPI0036EBA9D5
MSALPSGREVLTVEWLSRTELRLLLAPCDDSSNPLAHEQGHAAVVTRTDRYDVGQGAITSKELAAPAEPVVRLDHSREARRLLADLAAAAGQRWYARRRVWDVKGLEDGRVLAALDGTLVEVGPRRPYALVATDPDERQDTWVTALGAGGTRCRLLPHSWEPAEHYCGGPAVEVGRSLVYAGTAHPGRESQPGGVYVVRRFLSGARQWEHRSDHPAIHTDGETVCVAYSSGALAALDADDGSLLWRTNIEVDGVPTVALSLAVVPRDHLLVGTVDGRIL